MARRRRAFRLESTDRPLERRELMSQLGSPTAAEVQQAAAAPSHFHQNGINGLKLHKSFVNGLNDRLNNSSAQAARVTQAFQVFISNDRALAVNPPSGSTGATLSSLVANLKNEVTYALSTREVLSNRPSPSSASGRRVSPLAQNALIPYAIAQIDAMAATLAAAPPVTKSDGTLAPADPTPAANTAVNAILNALAETSVHPNLFQSPSDFYLSPDVTFTVNSTGAPASSSPGYFVRGPGGVVLPGAPRSHIPH